MDPNERVEVELPQFAAAGLYNYIRKNRDAVIEFMETQDNVEYGDEAVDIIEIELTEAAGIEWTEPE